MFLGVFLVCFYRPHPKDGEGTVFTGVCLFTPARFTPSPSHNTSTGPMSFPVCLVVFLFFVFLFFLTMQCNKVQEILMPILLSCVVFFFQVKRRRTLPRWSRSLSTRLERSWRTRRTGDPSPSETRSTRSTWKSSNRTKRFCRTEVRGKPYNYNFLFFLSFFFLPHANVALFSPSLITRCESCNYYFHFVCFFYYYINLLHADEMQIS